MAASMIGHVRTAVSRFTGRLEPFGSCAQTGRAGSSKSPEIQFRRFLQSWRQALWYSVQKGILGYLRCFQRVALLQPRAVRATASVTGSLVSSAGRVAA